MLTQRLLAQGLIYKIEDVILIVGFSPHARTLDGQCQVASNSAACS